MTWKTKGERWFENDWKMPSTTVKKSDKMGTAMKPLGLAVRYPLVT